MQYNAIIAAKVDMRCADDRAENILAAIIVALLPLPPAQLAIVVTAEVGKLREAISITSISQQGVHWIHAADRQSEAFQNGHSIPRRPAISTGGRYRSSVLLLRPLPR